MTLMLLISADGQESFGQGGGGVSAGPSFALSEHPDLPYT